jgi:hypothetical protein
MQAAYHDREFKPELLECKLALSLRSTWRLATKLVAWESNKIEPGVSVPALRQTAHSVVLEYLVHE